MFSKQLIIWDFEKILTLFFQLASSTLKNIQGTMNCSGKLKVLATGTSESQPPEHYREKRLKSQVAVFSVWTQVQLKKLLIMIMSYSSDVLSCVLSSKRPSRWKFGFLLYVNFESPLQEFRIAQLSVNRLMGIHGLEINQQWHMD